MLIDLRPAHNIRSNPKGEKSRLEWDLIKPRNSAVNLQKTQRTEEHVKLYHGDALSKIQIWKLHDQPFFSKKERKKRRKEKKKWKMMEKLERYNNQFQWVVYVYPDSNKLVIR